MTVSKVAVVGLGFVGLPLALSFSRKGVTTYGLDVSEQLIADLVSGHSELNEDDRGESLERILERELASGRFVPTLDPAQAYADVDAVLITVGMPVYGGEPQTTHLARAVKALAGQLHKGMTVIVRATVVPGTTRTLVRRLLEETGLTLGQDFYLAYCPERLAEGRAFEETRSMPIVIGAFDDESARRAQDVMRIVTEAEIDLASSPEAAELTKVVENAQRDVNIAIVQELARVCEAQGLDTLEVVRLANTHKRVQLLTPGCGVGGYCIPNAYYYLKPMADAHHLTLGTFDAARSTNDAVPQMLADLGKRHLERLGRPQGPVAVIGLAMKDNCGDARLSPALVLAETLRQTGVRVRAYDPMVDAVQYQVDSLEAAVAGAQVAYVLVGQEAYLEKVASGDWPARLASGALVIDTKGFLAERRGELEAKGLQYWAI